MNLFLFCVTLILALGVSQGFIQKMTLGFSSGETVDGNSFECTSIFKSKVANAAPFGIGNLTRVCYHGMWNLHSDADFASKPNYNFYMNETCYENERTFPYNSFRYAGPNDTSIESITLFESNFWVGQETIVTSMAHAGIVSGQSAVLTGKSKWTLFAGQNFEGRSACAGKYTDPDWDMDYWSQVNINFQLPNVGSVIKGCDAEVIADIQARARRGEKFDGTQ